MEILKAHIQKTTFTVTEAHHVLSVLRQVIDKIFFIENDGMPIDERYRAAVADLPDTDRHHLSSLSADFLKEVSGDNVHTVLHDVREWVESRPKLTLYIPVVFETEQLATIGTWCRSEMSPDMFLETIVEPSVVGGCAFIYKSSYHDMSLRARLHEDPTAIPNIIARYESA